MGREHFTQGGASTNILKQEHVWSSQIVKKERLEENRYERSRVKELGGGQQNIT